MRHKLSWEVTHHRQGVPELPHVVAMLPVRNEESRYLSRVLARLAELADVIVAYDDASTDATVEVCRSSPKVEVHRGLSPLLPVDESALREDLWHLVLEHEPEWVLALDADEEFEQRAVAELPHLMDQSDYDVIACRIFDHWGSESHVRVDGPWNPWNRFSPVAVRVVQGIPSAWPSRPIHCGRFPRAYLDRATFYSHLRVRHFGWARQEDHLRKYLFYRERDLSVVGKVRQQTESIISANVALEPWLDVRPAPWLAEWQEE